MQRCAVSSVSATSRRRCGCARSRRSYCSMARLPKSNSRSPSRNLPFARALHHVVPLQNHQKPVRGALVQLQRRCNLRQAERRFALTQQIQNSKCPVQSLNFICALGSCVSHIGPLFRVWIPYSVSQIWDSVNVATNGAVRACTLHLSSRPADDDRQAVPSQLRKLLLRQRFRACAHTSTASPSPGARNRFASRPCWRV